MLKDFAYVWLHCRTAEQAGNELSQQNAHSCESTGFLLAEEWGITLQNVAWLAALANAAVMHSMAQA